MTVIFIHGADGFDDDAPLAASLEQHLGVPVTYPRMPDTDDWGPAIAAALSEATSPLVLVAHSAGGYQLLKHLAAAPPLDIASIHIIAAPFPGGDPDWTFDGFDLPTHLDRIPRPIYLYASEDDEVVPFAHRDLWAVELPGAQVRTTSGGHQLHNDLTLVSVRVASAP